MSAILIRTIIIYILLNVMLKIMGKRQIGELEVNELVSTLLISEIASIPISEPDVPLVASVIPIIFICSLEIAISAIKTRSAKLKRLVEGEGVYIIYKGKLRQDLLEENRISINEILTEMRTQNIGDISQVEYAILEQNGKLSLFKADDGLAHSLIVDGKVDERNLKKMGLNKKWLRKQLTTRGVEEGDVFLLTVNDDGQVYLIEKEKKR